MTAIQLLEKLGADSKFAKSDLSPQNFDAIRHLSNGKLDFSAPLTHVSPDDEDDDEGESESESKKNIN